MLVVAVGPSSGSSGWVTSSSAGVTSSPTWGLATGLATALVVVVSTVVFLAAALVVVVSTVVFLAAAFVLVVSTVVFLATMFVAFV